MRCLPVHNLRPDPVYCWTAVSQTVMRLNFHTSRAKWTPTTQVTAQILLSANTTNETFIPILKQLSAPLIPCTNIWRWQKAQPWRNTQKQDRETSRLPVFAMLTSKTGGRILTEFMSQCVDGATNTHNCHFSWTHICSASLCRSVCTCTYIRLTSVIIFKLTWYKIIYWSLK